MQLVRTIRTAFVVVFVVGTAYGGASGGTEPSASELVSLAAKLETGTPEMKSLHVRIVQRSDDVGFLADARAGDSVPAWLVVADVADGTPIMVCADGRGAIYDLAHGTLHWFDSAHFDVLAYGGSSTVVAACSMTSGANHITLDLKSIVNLGGPPSVARDGAGYIVKRNSARGGSLVARIDPRAKFPYSDIRGYAKLRDEPVMVIAPIDINQHWNGAAPHMPNVKDLASHLRLVRLPQAAATLDARREELTEGFGTLMLRVALRHPAKRAEVAKQLGMQADWGILAARDKQMSSELRHLFAQPLAASHVPATQPAE